MRPGSPSSNHVELMSSDGAHLLLRPAARLFAHELLGRAIKGARRTASGIQGARGRSDNNTGVLAVHNLGIASDQASRGRLRRYQWSWKQWRWQDLPLRRYLAREACASRMRSDARAVEMPKAASRIESCRTYLIQSLRLRQKES